MYQTVSYSCKRSVSINTDYIFAPVLQGYTSRRVCSSSTSSSSSSSEYSAAHLGGFSETFGHYDRLVRCGSLREDAQQRGVIQQLALLQHTLKNYSNSMYLHPPPSQLNPNQRDSEILKDKDSHRTSSENKGDGCATKVERLLDWHEVF